MARSYATYEDVRWLSEQLAALEHGTLKAYSAARDAGDGAAAAVIMRRRALVQEAIDWTDARLDLVALQTREALAVARDYGVIP